MEGFGVKYAREKYKKHLLDSLNQYYKVTIDEKRTQCLGIILQWDYKNRRVYLSMLGYIPKALKQFGHKRPPKLQDQPYRHAPPSYGAKIKYTKAIENLPQFQRGIKYLSCK